MQQNMCPITNVDPNNVIEREAQFLSAAQKYFDSLDLKISPRRENERMMRSKKEIEEVTKRINEEKKDGRILKSVERKTKHNSNLKSLKRKKTGENRVDMQNFVGNEDFENLALNKKQKKESLNGIVKKDEGKNFGKRFDRKKLAFDSKRKTGKSYNFKSTNGKQKSKNRPGKSRRNEMRQKSTKK